MIEVPLYSTTQATSGRDWQKCVGEEEGGFSRVTRETGRDSICLSLPVSRISTVVTTGGVQIESRRVFVIDAR